MPSTRSGRPSSTSLPGRSKNGPSRRSAPSDKLFLSITMLAVIAVLAAVAGAVGNTATADRQRADRGGRRRRRARRCCPDRAADCSTSSPRSSARCAGLWCCGSSPRKAPSSEDDSAPDPVPPTLARRVGAAGSRCGSRGVVGGVAAPSAALGGRRTQRRRGAAGARHRTAGAAGRSAERRCAAELRHQQRRLLPDRHRVARPAGQPQRLAAEDPRHGRPRDHLQLRRSRGVRARREDGDADLCLQSRSAAT